MTFYLASTSPRRKTILKELGIRFKTLKPRYHEAKFPGLAPGKLVRRHAIGKADSAAKLIKNGIIVAADTIVYHDSQVIGKPRDMKEAFRILEKLQGRWHTVYTGVVILKVDFAKVIQKKFFFEKTKVHLKQMDKETIVKYFKKIDPLDKAGAYAIQSKEPNIVSGIRGSFSNAVGLPKGLLLKHLRRFDNLYSQKGKS